LRRTVQAALEIGDNGSAQLFERYWRSIANALIDPD
jgi:hypothetical protein